MASSDAYEIAEMLAARAETVCRAYLPKGRKEGNYWMIGDATGVPGKSTYVRLSGPLSGKGAAGKWTDAASGDHGNLLDIIKLSRGLTEFREVLAEARRFLALPDRRPALAPQTNSNDRRPSGDAKAAAGKIFTGARSLVGSPAETYLRQRGIALQPDFDVLRFHPRCYVPGTDGGKPQAWPALVAAVTDLGANLTGVSRTFLAHDGLGKAPIDTARRAKGDILGNGIRFGRVDTVLGAGEGIETTLSLRAVLPALPLVAATSSSHLSGLLFPPTLRTLLVIRDNDYAGDAATDALFTRGQAAGIDVILIEPELDDLNSDLMKLGRQRLAERVRSQVPAALFERFVSA